MVLFLFLSPALLSKHKETLTKTIELLAVSGSHFICCNQSDLFPLVSVLAPIRAFVNSKIGPQRTIALWPYSSMEHVIAP